MGSDPFDFSDFGPPRRPASPPPPPQPAPGRPSRQHGGAPVGRPSAPADGGGLGGGFDPWAGQSTAAPTQAGPAHSGAGFGSAGFGAPPEQDAFGHSASPAGGVGPAGGLQTAGPPLRWFAIALALALTGVVIGVVGILLPGGVLTPVSAVLCWLLAGPVAIGALSVYSRVDTRRRSEAIYSAPTWAGTLYWAVLAGCFVGIALGAWRIALWAGHL